MSKLICYSILLFSFLTNSALAEDDPIVTRIEGEAFLMHSPSKVVRGDPPRVQYRNHFYNLKKLELGDKLTRLAIIKTNKESKVKLIFENGDLIHVAPGSMFKIDEHSRAENKQSIFNLIAGKFRALIEPNGPRSPTNVRTRTVAMGVRGTDFFVNSRNSSGEVELSVLRGEVSVSSLDKGNQTVTVKTGQKAKIKDLGKFQDLNEAVILKQMEQGDLIAIHGFIGMSNKYKYGESMMALTSAPKSKLQLKLEALEKKAAEVMIKDIKLHDPQKYQENSGAKTTDKIDYIK